MTKWTDEQSDFLSSQDDFHVSPFYSDGETYGTPTWLWSVVVDDDLYIKAYNGQDSRWYKSAVVQGAGQMVIKEESYPVYYTAIETDAELTGKIDRTSGKISKWENVVTLDTILHYQT